MSQKAEAQRVPDSFMIGKVYSYESVSEPFGGPDNFGLPYVSDRVTCARLNPAKNPDAPYTVPIATGPRNREAGRTLAEQEASVPLFLKDDTDEWRYIGLYKSVDTTEDDEILADHIAKTDRDEIDRLVFLEPTEKGLSSGTEVRVFDSGDEPYFRWMDEHPEGFVLNTHPGRTSRYATFHISGCSWISPNENYEPGGYTERDYIKVCSPDIRVLKEWVWIERPRARAGDLKRCGHCNPSVNVSSRKALLPDTSTRHRKDNQNIDQFANSLGPGITVTERKEVTQAEISGGEIDITLQHNLLQKELFGNLSEQFGADSVEAEVPSSSGGKIDLVVEEGPRRIVYEIKAGRSPKSCIRDAIGQLLEYSLWPGATRPVKMIVVGEQEINSEAERYLKKLNAHFSLSVEYECIRLDSR